MIRPEPGMGTAIPKHHQPLLGFAFPPLAMLGRPTFSFGLDSCRPPYLPYGFPTQLQFFLFHEFLGKMGVVELRIVLAG